MCVCVCGCDCLLVWVYDIYKLTVLFQPIQCSITMPFSSILPIDKTLLGATTPGQSGPGSDGGKGVLRIPQISNITEILQ